MHVLQQPCSFSFELPFILQLRLTLDANIYNNNTNEDCNVPI